MGGNSEYRGADFSVRIVPGFREIGSVVITRSGTARTLDGERIGKKWEGIGIHLPNDVDLADVPDVVRDLEEGLHALGYGFVITRTGAIEGVSEREQEAALDELHRLGFEVESSPDRKQISLRPKREIPRHDTPTSGAVGQRVSSLVRSLTGIRHRVELLAASAEFASDPDPYIPR